MKKRTYESWVASFVGRLGRHFNIQGWQLFIEHSDEDPETSNGNCEYARICVDSTYQTAHIYLNKQARLDYEEDNLPRLIHALVHELVHIFLDPFNELLNPHLSDTTRPFASTILEQQTQKITAVLIKTLPKSLIPKR